MLELLRCLGASWCGGFTPCKWVRGKRLEQRGGCVPWGSGLLWAVVLVSPTKCEYHRQSANLYNPCCSSDCGPPLLHRNIYYLAVPSTFPPLLVSHRPVTSSLWVSFTATNKRSWLPLRFQSRTFRARRMWRCWNQLPRARSSSASTKKLRRS